MDHQEKVIRHKPFAISKHSKTALDVVNQLEQTVALANNNRINLNIPAVVESLKNEDPDMICHAIECGRRGDFGDVYQIDGITVIGWINRLKELQRQMNFGLYD